jgi:hypothetical protein
VLRFTNGFVLNLTGPYRMFFDRVNTPSTADKRQFTFLNGSHLETYYGSHRLAGSTTSDTLRGGAMYFKDSSSNHFNTKWAVRAVQAEDGGDGDGEIDDHGGGSGDEDDADDHAGDDDLDDEMLDDDKHGDDDDDDDGGGVPTSTPVLRWC